MAKKKTKRNKILIPRIKELQTTPDLSLINPILEDNTIICLHGGRVQLKAKNAKRIKSENIPLMLNNEIQGASIIGCPNPPILGGPCTKVTLVFPYTLTQHKVNNKRAVLQMGLIGVSNKGYPILAIPKKNKIQFSPLKLPSNPLPKIEYQRNQWEGIKERVEESSFSVNSITTSEEFKKLNPNQKEKFYEYYARKATRNKKSNKIVLGKWEENSETSYERIGEKEKITYFLLNKKDSNLLKKILGKNDKGEDNRWNINKKFLEEQIKQDKMILLSHDPKKYRNGSFAKELDFLEQNGYNLRDLKKIENGLLKISK